MEPPRHPSLKARNKHRKKPAKELCLCFLWLTEPRSEVQAPPPRNRTVSARTHVIELLLVFHQFPEMPQAMIDV